MCAHMLTGSRHLQPRRIFFQSAEKFLEPSISIAVLKRSGPHAKFFHVITEGSDSTRVKLRGILQEIDGFLSFAKRNEVTKFPKSRKKPDELATIFGDVWSEQFVRLKSSGEKRQIVD